MLDEIRLQLCLLCKASIFNLTGVGGGGGRGGGGWWWGWGGGGGGGGGGDKRKRRWPEGCGWRAIIRERRLIEERLFFEGIL